MTRKSLPIINISSVIISTVSLYKIVCIAGAVNDYDCQWNCCAGNKLHAIRPTVGDYKQKTCLSRCDTVLLNRLRIGHTRLTHSYLLSGDDLPECGTCQCPLTVKHILVECIDVKDVRNKHFVASSIKDLFDSIEARINLEWH